MTTPTPLTADRTFQSVITSPDINNIANTVNLDMVGPRRRAVHVRTPATVVERFQSGHGWSAATLTQTSNDTSQVGLGTQSMLLTSAASFGYSRKTGYAAQDLSTRHPRIWLTVEDITSWGSGAITVYAAPAGGLAAGNYYSWSISADTSANLTSNAIMLPPGQMVCLDLPWSAAFAAGTVAKTAITEWQVAISPGGTAGLKMWVHGIDIISNLVTKYPNGVVTICMDDSYVGQWDLARAAMAKYGYPAHLFPIISSIGQPGSWTLAQLKTLTSAFGWEVGAHCMDSSVHSNYNSMTQDAVAADMRQCIRWFELNGLKCDTYAYPLGTFTQNQADVPASGLFSAARSIHPGLLGQLPPVNLSKLRSRSGVGGSGGFGVTTSGTTGTYGVLSSAKAGSSWPIFTIHNITTAASGNVNTISSADFTTLIDSIATLGMEVATISQVLDSIRY